MTTFKTRFTLAAIVTFAAASGLQASPFLYTIGPDPNNGVPNVFTQIDVASQTVTKMFGLGNGAIGIIGGVAYSAAANTFYTMSADSFANSQLESLAVAGPVFTDLYTVGVGFNGGLTYVSANGLLYAAGNDAGGSSSLWSLPAVAGGAATFIQLIGTGFTGGLAFDSIDGSFYAISNLNDSKVYRIDLAAGGTVTPLSIAFGSANRLHGGLAFDAATNTFYTIGNDNSGLATLYSFDLNSAQPTALFALGYGYGNAGLAIAPEQGVAGVAAPEPASVALMILGIGAIGLRTMTRRIRNASLQARRQ